LHGLERWLGTQRLPLSVHDALKVAFRCRIDRTPDCVDLFSQVCYHLTVRLITQRVLMSIFSNGRRSREETASLPDGVGGQCLSSMRQPRCSAMQAPLCSLLARPPARPISRIYGYAVEKGINREHSGKR